MPDLVELGFAFSANNADTEINKVVSALENAETKGNAAKEALRTLIDDTFKANVRAATKALGKFNAGLVQTAGIAKNTLTAIKPLPAQIGKISLDRIKPVPGNVITSLEDYAKRAAEAARAVERLGTSIGTVKPGPVVNLSTAMRQTGRHAEDLGESISQIFRAGTLAAFFKKSTEMAVRFGEELAHINSLTLEFDIAKIRKGLLDIGSQYGSATQNANALYYAYSSGVRGSEADLVDFTKQMSGLATLIRADVTQTMDAATAAMNAYNLSAKDAAELTNLFYGIVKQGKARGSELASGLGQVISTAKTAGLSLDEMGASIASLTKVMKTRQAITFFNNMLSKMIKPTKETRLAAEKLGIELGVDALRAKGFAGAMQEIHEKTKGSQQAILSLFPDLRGQRAALQLLGAGWGDFQNQLQFFANKSGIADEAMKALTKDVYFQLSRIPDTFNKIKIATGDLLTQIFTLGGVLTPVISWFNNLGESGQKVVSAMTLIAGGYLLVKTSQKVKLAMSLLEMKYNDILSKQRAKETRDHIAVAASINAETAARKSAIAVQSTQGGANIFGTLSRGTGFLGGFGREGIKGLLAWRRAFQYRAIGESGVFRSMGSVITAFGTGLGKVASLALKVFNPAVMLITGAVATVAGLIDVLSAEGDTWSEKAANSRVVSKIGEGLYDFFTGALTEAKRLQKMWEMEENLKWDRKSIDDWKTRMVEQFSEPLAKFLPADKQFNILSEKYSDAAKSLSSKEFRDAAREINEARAELDEMIRISTTSKKDLRASAANQKMALDAYQKALKFSNDQLKQFYSEVEAADGNFAKMDKTIWSIRRRLAKQYGKNKVIYSAGVLGGEVWQKLERDLAKSQDKLEERRKSVQERFDKNKAYVESITKNFQKNADLMRNFFEAQSNALRSIYETLEKHRFSKLSPQEQVNEQISTFLKARESYFQAVSKRDYTTAQEAFKTGFEAYNSVIKDAEAKINNYQDFRDSLKNDAFDYLLKSTKDLPERLKLISQRAKELYEESGGEWLRNIMPSLGAAAGAFSVGPSVDLKNSFKSAIAAAKLEIQAMQEEINAKQKLADAERRANENTLRLIQSMDKFTATTVDAVSATSTEAQRLQSRGFFGLTNARPATTAQQGIGQSQRELDARYKALVDLIKAYQSQAESLQNAAETQRRNIDTNFEEWAKKIQEDRKSAESYLKTLAEGMVKAAEEIGRTLKDDKSAKDLKTISDHVKDIAKISVVTY